MWFIMSGRIDRQLSASASKISGREWALANLRNDSNALMVSSAVPKPGPMATDWKSCLSSISVMATSPGSQSNRAHGTEFCMVK